MNKIKIASWIFGTVKYYLIIKMFDAGTSFLSTNSYREFFILMIGIIVTDAIESALDKEKN